MAHIKIRKGLDLCLEGAPEGELKRWESNGRVALDLSSFDGVAFELLKKEGDEVKIGEPLARDKGVLERHFVSPASGTVVEIRRGEKRRPLFIVIEEKGEGYFKHEQAEVIDRWLSGGGFSHIWSRPGNRLAHPKKRAKSIFVKALESAPLTPSSARQVVGREKWFQGGIDALAQLAPVHLIAKEGTFEEVKGVHYHTAAGPHPISSPSLHISLIDPVRSLSDEVWTVSVQDVIVLGRLALEGLYERERVVSFKGGYYLTPAGALLEGIPHEGRLISGDPLMGKEMPFLGFSHTVISLLKNPPLEREWFHFVGFRKPPLTTHQHGEERPFVDGAIYDKVMPLKISTMHLIKALMVGDFEKALELGLLEVASEDFALPTYICPSKIEMTTLVHEKLNEFSLQYLS